MGAGAAKPAVAAFGAPGGHAAMPEGPASGTSRANIVAAIDRIDRDAGVEPAAAGASAAKLAVAAFRAAGRHAAARDGPARIAGRTLIAAAIHHPVRNAAATRPAMGTRAAVAAFAALHRTGRDRVLGRDMGRREDSQRHDERHEKSDKTNAKPGRGRHAPPLYYRCPSPRWQSATERAR